MNTLQYLNESKFTGLDDILDLKKDMFKRRITISYENSLKDGKRRIIFTGSKSLRIAGFDQMCMECNGLILEASNNGWRMLCIPVFSPKSNITSKTVNTWLYNKVYDIYAIDDGTIVNLYYHNAHWVISTSRGIDMNNMVFNTISYQNMLEECIKKYTPLDKFYNSLDKKYCYTFGFKHPDMHPFSEGPTKKFKLWSVQQVCISDLTFFKNPVSGIPTQKKLEYDIKNIHQLYKKLSAAYDAYVNGKLPNYGYMLVSNDTYITADHSILLLESSLLKTIRALWYNSSYTKFSKSKNMDRIKIIILSSYLDDENANKFITLFPQYAPEFKNIDSVECELIQNIYKNIVHNANVISAGTSRVMNDVSLVLTNKVVNTMDVKLHEKPLQKIRDIIHIVGNIEYYYAIWNDATSAN